MPPSEKRGSVREAGGDASNKKAKGVQQAKSKGSIKDDKKGKDDPKAKGSQAKSRDDSKGKKGKEPEPEIPPLTPSQLALQHAEERAMARRNRHKKHWPEVTKVKLNLRPWSPPGPPERPPAVEIDYPELTLRKWVPPYRRRRRPRPALPRLVPEEINHPLPYDSQLKKNWHGFKQIESNKMMCQGTIACNSKRYSATACGSQTGCIAVVCRALLEEKTPAQLVKRDVDDVIDCGDKYYRQCMTALKCYKGNPALQLNQLLTQFFFHETKYTVKLTELDTGILAKHPDNPDKSSNDLMALMEKRQGSNYMLILSLGSNKHFLIWGHPPEGGAGASVKTICYIFDPHMLDAKGETHNLNGAGAFLRYPGVNSFVVDFLINHGNLDATTRNKPKPPVALTSVEIVQKEPLLREPWYEVDMKTLKPHCLNEWQAMNVNMLIDDKMRKGKYPMHSLSAVSLATSRSKRRGKVHDYYQKITPKEPPPTLPIAPERPPPPPTEAQVMQLRGENFFLHCPRTDAHTFGRDDRIPFKESETLLHSPVDVMEKGFKSQFKQVDVGKWVLRGTRHFASLRYNDFKWFTGVACCVAAMGMLRKLRARGWNEDTVDETLDAGYNLFRDSLAERGGPIRRLVLGELKKEFKIRNREYKHKQRGIAVWGKLISQNPKVFDLCRGIERFFKEADTGVLQIPGEYETAIWNEGGKYYVYHPWPADRYGYRVSLQGGGKACLMSFGSVARLCEHFFENVRDLKRKPFAISDVSVFELGERPEPVNKMQPVGPNRWVVRGHYHEGDERFPEDHRNKQATPASIAAIAMAAVLDPSEWTPEDIDETLNRGDILYENTMENLEKLGINFETPKPEDEEGGGEEEEGQGQGPSGTLAAADVLPRFRITDYDCIETDVDDSAYSGLLNADKGSGVMSLKDSLKTMFVHNKAAVLTARGSSLGVFKHNDFYYMFDPHGCDENGYPTDDPRGGAALIRMKSNVNELADVIMGNLPAGSDDSFNLSPVEIQAAKLNAEIGAPLLKAENRAFEWMNRGTAAILMGPRGENSAIGKSAQRAGIPTEDLAGRILALPAAAAFCAVAAESVQPPGMHQDHMFNFLDAASEYYRNHVKNTGRKDIGVEDLNEKFEMGANTYTLEIGEPTRLPLRLPDQPAEGGGDEEEEEKELAEGEELGEPPLKQMKELLFKIWYDNTKPTTVSLLLGDYHQIGVWMAAGGKVVAFDPAPTLYKGLLTPQRIKKGDELRLQRIKDEKGAGEDAGEEEDEDEVGGEGEEKPEPEPEFVPPESCPVLMVCATPGEFIDRLVAKGGLDPKQMVGPAWLYPVTVNNELTQVLKERKPGARKGEGDEEGNEDEEPDQLIDPLEDAAMGKYFTRMGRAIASVRGRVAQNENYFMDSPNRDNQDAANAVMGIVVDHIEPYTHWKASLIDAILKYGDRLHTMSLPNAKKPPKLSPSEIVKEFHVTNFNVKVEVSDDVINGDIKAGESGSVLNIKRAIKKFFETGNKYGVICAKDYCVGIWKAADDKAYCMWEPHPVGPTGRTSPAGAGGLILFSNIDELAETYRKNVEDALRPGNNKFTVSPVKVFWEFAKVPSAVTPQGAVPDEGYEWKVLTAFVEIARGRTILRGSRPSDLIKFTRDALLQSAASAIVGACMTHVRRPHLWSRKTVDEILCIGCQVFTASLGSLGYEFRPGEDVLLPLQVLKRFVLGSNYIRYDIEAVFNGKLEQKEPTEMTVRAALERFFETNTHGILWSTPYAVAIWKVPGSPSYYMMEPHACGTEGLRTDAQDDGAACVLTFTSPKLMAFAYLQNTPIPDRFHHEFTLYAMRIVPKPIKSQADPPLLNVPPGSKLVPATSKVDFRGQMRHADEKERRHPPGSTTCMDAQRAADVRDKENAKFRGRRNNNGWLVLADGTQFLSANHSMACRKFPAASRGNQATACCVMSVAMSRVEDVCRWCNTTLDQILESGDQLYQDSYLHYRPKKTRILQMKQILRKFYTPGNCVCRLVVFQPRQEGYVDKDLHEKVLQFFREEKAGVFVSQDGMFAVALFKTPRGFYMFDPADRDRYGRAVAPPCTGRARACFSQYPTVKHLTDKLGANIPPVYRSDALPAVSPGRSASRQSAASGGSKSKTSISPNRSSQLVESAAPFAIYGMNVTDLRRLNKHEK